MSALESFHYENWQVRTVVVNGKPWFVAADVCAVLDIANPTRALASLDDDERGLHSMKTPGGVQEMAIVSEAGLYSLILRSRKPQARPFRRWVTHDLLPAVRRDGGYLAPDASHEQLVQLADRAAAQARVLQALSGIVDPKWLEAKARHVAAQALGEEPEVEFDSRPLTVGAYLEEKGIRATVVRRVSPTVGKRVKALYVAEHGVEPPMVDRFVDGALRKVRGYAESDRPLFDRAWSQIDAEIT